MASFFKDDEMVVLPKDDVAEVKNVDLNINIDSAGERTILPSDVAKNIIRNSGPIFIMNFCLCRRSNKCEDFPIDHGCIFLGKGVNKIPPEFGRMATAEEACGYLDECSELGLVHIIGRNKLDSIWLSTGNKKDLITLCNCCPCCCLWNMTRDISDEISAVYRRMDGVEVAVDKNKCIGCAKCWTVCFTKAISITDGKCTIDERCRGCGRCVSMCPTKAISITYDRAKADAEIERIGKLLEFD